MTQQNKIFDYVTELFGVPTTPQLPEGEGYASQIAPGYINKTFLDRRASQTLSILLLGKNKKQEVVSDKLYEICNNLKNVVEFDYGIYSIEIATPPNYITKEGDFWIWSCIINVNFIL